MKTRILSTSDPPMVEIRFSDAQVVHEYSGDVIAKVNRDGNWIRGLEMLGSGVQFSLERALSNIVIETSAVNVQHPQAELAVTYDEEANAGFLYLAYSFPNSVAQESKAIPLLLRSSYSIEDDNAKFGLDADKTVVFIRFKIPNSERMENFMRLFGQVVPRQNSIRSENDPIC